jgi:hypothetical protein
MGRRQAVTVGSFEILASIILSRHDERGIAFEPPLPAEALPVIKQDVGPQSWGVGIA